MRKELNVILATTSKFALAGQKFAPIYAVFVEEIGGDILTAGGAYGLFGISTGLLMLLTARIEDRVKHQEMQIVLSNFMCCMGFLGYHFISSPIQLFIIQVVFAVSEAVGKPVCDAVYSRAVD